MSNQSVIWSVLVAIPLLLTGCSSLPVGPINSVPDGALHLALRVPDSAMISKRFSADVVVSNTTDNAIMVAEPSGRTVGVGFRGSNGKLVNVHFLVRDFYSDFTKPRIKVAPHSELEHHISFSWKFDPAPVLLANRRIGYCVQPGEYTLRARYSVNEHVRLESNAALLELLPSDDPKRQRRHQSRKSLCAKDSEHR